jgi:hypothetical protein
VKQFQTIPAVCRAVIAFAARAGKSVRNLAADYELGRNTIYEGARKDLPRRHSIAAMLLLQEDMSVPVEERGIAFEECSKTFICLLKDDYYVHVQIAREEIFDLLHTTAEQRAAVLKQLN